MIVVKPAVKLLHDVHDLWLFPEWVHDADTFGQFAGVLDVCVEVDDVVCEGHFHKAKVGNWR